MLQFGSVFCSFRLTCMALGGWLAAAVCHSAWLLVLAQFVAMAQLSVAWLRARRSPGVAAWSAGLLPHALLLLLFADAAYELRPASVPRYPYNLAADAAYVLAWTAIFWQLCAAFVASCLRQGRSRLAAETTAVLCLLAFTLWAQQHFVLDLLKKQHPDLPGGLRVLPTAYAYVSAACAALLLWVSSRLRQIQDWLAAMLLLGMLACDFAARHQALLSPSASVGYGELGWGLAMVALFALLASAHGGRCGPVWARPLPLQPLRSVHSASAQGICFGLAVALGSLAWAGWLQLADASAFTAFLLLLWALFAAIQAQAMALSWAICRAAASLPVPQRSLRRTGALVCLPPPKAPQLAEFRLWLGAYARMMRAVDALAQQSLRRRAAQLRQRLTAQWVHELRGPLAAIDSAAQALQLCMTSEAQAQDVRGLSPTLLAAVARARRLADGLLDGAWAPAQVRAYDGAALGRFVQHALAEAALRHACTGQLRQCLTRPLPADMRWLCDADGLQAALATLLDNALQVCKAEHVQVQLRRIRGKLCIDVVDAGPGIAPALLRRLGRVPVTANKACGHGLGLLTARHRAKAWGGGLRLRSAGGRGTRASLYLPRQKRQRTKPVALTAHARILLDDDPLLRQAWAALAQERGDVLYCFAAAEACVRSVRRLPWHLRATLRIDVDVHLPDGATGHAWALYLRLLGCPKAHVLAPNKPYLPQQ